MIFINSGLFKSENNMYFESISVVRIPCIDCIGFKNSNFFKLEEGGI